jgi:hypothetical protein
MGQPKHPKPLSVAQMLILRTAAERPDRMVLPISTGLRARDASQINLLTSLLNATLVEEVATGHPHPRHLPRRALPLLRFPSPGHRRAPQRP